MATIVLVGVIVLGPWAGSAADRYDRRKLLMATQIASAAISGLLALLAASGLLTVPLVFASALLLGISGTFSVPTMLSLVPQLVLPENLGPAVALNIVFVALAVRVWRNQATDAAGMGPEKRLFAYSILYLFILFGALVVDRLMLP